MNRVRRSPRLLAVGILAVVAAFFAGSALRAEHTRYWRQSSFEEFDKGIAKGVALRSDGKLMLAPRFEPMSDPNSAFLWALRADSKGNVYVAGGSGAKVVRYDAAGKTSTFFTADELSAQALEVDARDNLYVGTSPDGRVYKVSPTGEKKIFFEPKTKYIWALALDSDGTLYVATGDGGTIFSVKPDGKGEVFYKSDEAHIRAITFDHQGNLLAGTEPDGRIIRISKSAPPAGKPRQGFVVYETSKKEITALIEDGAGNLYVAAIGDKSRNSGATFADASEILNPSPTLGGGQPGGGNVFVLGGAPQQPTIGQTPFVPLSSANGSAVYRLAPDGSPQQLWSSRDTLVYALGLSPTGKLLLGTGNRGIVISLDGNNLYTTLAKTESGQVTALAQGAGGKIFMCTANPGKVFSLGPGDVGEGTFESQPIDSRFFSAWGRLEWWGENSGMSASGRPHVEVYIRAGNTANPDSNWSAWAGPYMQSGQKVDAPAARFAQWKAVLRSGSPSPVLSWMSLSYLPKNVAPQIDGIAVQDPGIRIQGGGLSGNIGGGGNQGSTRLRQPEVFGAPSSSSSLGFNSGGLQDRPSPRFDSSPGQGSAQKGFQSVLWSSHDDNDDELVYRIYFRGENEKEWKLLKDNLREKYYSWDTTSMADGAYYLKIVASDAPSNPPAEALENSRESERFVVDNTPPELTGLEAGAGENSSETRIQFTAKDSASAIARAEYSLDAGEWTLVYPAGRLSDAVVEKYDIPLHGLAAGEHTIAVRVYDRFENVAASKITFHSPTGGR
jgi:DNA-binding beta-propeller fold protein YncE